MSEHISTTTLDSFILSDIAHVEMGQSPDSRYVVEDPFQGLAFLQGNAEFGAVYPEPKFGCLRPAKRCKANDVLISVRAPVGAINVADRDYCIGRGLAAIRAQGIKPSLLGEVVARQSTALRRVAQGTTFEAINKKDLLTLKLSLPPKTDWSQLAEILDTLDTAIHETEAIIAKLKAVKQGLLHDLLTRGVDANGELRPPQAEAPHLYKESPLGWIPKEWDAVKLSKSIGLISGQHIEAELCNSVGKGVPYFTGPSDFLGAGTIVTQYTNRPQIMCDEADILLTVKGSGCGKVAISGVKACISRQLMAIKVPARALQYWFAVFQSLQEHFNRMATGGNIPGISRAQILDLLVAIPNVIDEMEAIGNRIHSINARLDSELLTLEKLKLEKAGLIADLLTGRVRVTQLLAEAAQQPGSA